MVDEKIYALYKGDDCIATGTAKEIAEQTGVSVKTIHFYSTPSYKKRVSDKNGRRLIEI